ncbi:unnamed protein product [Rotaria sp. Silwood2]|nr:unnamed protein product [Rotaria sp. Silwood2]CAF3973742.1 unnamed protein product [Rotaria sp. Silwood2]
MPAPLKPSFIETIHHDIYETINPRTTLANKARGKTILITGAGRGIGRAAAIAFAHAGADRLILTARTASQLDATANEVKAVSNEVEIMKIQTDMTNESQIDTLFRAIQAIDQYDEENIIRTTEYNQQHYDMIDISLDLFNCHHQYCLSW